MAKTIVINILIFLLSCNSKLNTTNDRFDDFFLESRSFQFNDHPDISGTSSAGIYINDSLICFNDFTRNNLLLLNTNTKQIQKIGSNGQGPGEYTVPYFFSYSNGILTFSDLQDLKLTQIDLQGRFHKKIQKPLYSNSNKFVEVDGSFYVLRRASTDSYYMENNWGEQMFPVKKCFQKDYPVKPNAGIFRIAEKIYFMNAYEAKIYSYDTVLKHESELKIKKMPFSEDWEAFYDKPLNHLQLREKYNNKFLYSYFGKIQNTEKSYFIIAAMKVGKRSENERYLFLIDMGGNILLKKRMDENNGILASGENGLLMAAYESYEGLFTIKEYRLKKLL